VSTIRLLTAAPEKSGDDRLPLEELEARLAGADSAWVDMLNPGEPEREFLLETLGFHPLAVEDCFDDAVTRA